MKWWQIYNTSMTDALLGVNLKLNPGLYLFQLLLFAQVLLALFSGQLHALLQLWQEAQGQMQKPVWHKGGGGGFSWDVYHACSSPSSCSPPQHFPAFVSGMQKHQLDWANDVRRDILGLWAKRRMITGPRVHRNVNQSSSTQSGTSISERPFYGLPFPSPLPSQLSPWSPAAHDYGSEIPNDLQFLPGYWAAVPGSSYHAAKTGAPSVCSPYPRSAHWSVRHTGQDRIWHTHVWAQSDIVYDNGGVKHTSIGKENDIC